MAQRLDLVRRYQQRLLEIIATARPLIAEPASDTNLLALKYLRIEMVDALRLYIELVDELAGAYLAASEPDALDKVRSMRADGEAMQQSYDAFRARWLHRDARSNWSEYRLSATAMMKRVRNHVLHSAGTLTT